MKPEWGALGWDNNDGKFRWANPDDSYYRILGFVAHAYWDGGRWVRLRGR